MLTIVKQTVKAIVHATALTMIACGIVMIGVVVLLSGCGQKDIGTSFKSDKSGRPDLVNQSPVTLTIEDDVKKGVANGPGPARFTSITADEVQTFQSGTTPRDMFVQLPSGAKFNLSSGTDINAEGIEFDPATGGFKISKFGTSASEPLRAGNEAYDRLIVYWSGRDQASKDAIIAELKAIEASTPVVAGLVGNMIQLLSGIP